MVRCSRLPAYTGPGRTVELERLGYKDATGSWVIRNLTATLQGPALVTVTDEVPHAKSMLLELLLRLRRPHMGRIYLDGQDARKVQVADIRRRMGWVDRDRRLLDIDGVLCLVKPPAAGKEWHEAAWSSTQRIAPTAQLDQYVETLGSSGTSYARDGHIPSDVHLRLVVCCALLHDPPVLLLDNPTLDLDAEGVERFIEGLQETAHVRLVIVATNDSRIIQISSQTIELPRVASAPREDIRVEKLIPHIGNLG